MKTLRALSLSIVTLAALSQSAFAEKDDIGCSVYGSMGQSISDFMLPLTIQELVNILTGKDPKLAGEMATQFVGGLSGEELIALGKLGETNAELLGGAAGQVAMQLLMSAQATSSQEVKDYMQTTCNDIGVENIIANQKKARAATQAIMGK